MDKNGGGGAVPMASAQNFFIFLSHGLVLASEQTHFNGFKKKCICVLTIAMEAITKRVGLPKYQWIGCFTPLSQCSKTEDHNILLK